MTIADFARAAWRYLGQWGEAIDHDPVIDLEKRVARLEREVGREQPLASPNVSDPGGPRRSLSPPGDTGG